MSCRPWGKNKSLRCGAEMLVLEEGSGVVGVDGSAEVDGDTMCCWELSSARTTFAGVPPRIQDVKDALRLWMSATGMCRVEDIRQ
jgi:hypothetical protein